MPYSSDKPYVVISGLPGSGKSTLARRLAPLLKLPVIDKDDILERLFEAKGIGDKAWRRGLSRESDEIFQKEARETKGAILVSFWRLPGMASDSGTPTEWLLELSKRILNLHCTCSLEIAAERCLGRNRHPGHLDAQASRAEVMASIAAVSSLGRPEIGHRLEVDTSNGQFSLEDKVGQIFRFLGGPFPDRG
jgi:AAA domain-containing protein